MKPKDIVELLKQTFQEWQEDKAAKLAAALAYYTAFAIAPLLIIAISIAALVFGDDAARGEIAKQLQGQVGKTAAEAIQTMIQNSHKPAEGTIATIISVVILFFGASGVFIELQDSLNTIWEVAPKPGQGIKGAVKSRFLSFAMVLGIGFLLLASLLLSAILEGVGAYFGNSIPHFVFLWKILNFFVSFGVVTLLFAMIYRLLPDVKIAWSDVWLGATITSVLFTIGKWAIGLYLGNSSVASPYGAAGSFVVFLLWVNYSAQILFFGAEFTQVYANKHGSKIVPDKNAVPLTDKARAQLGIPHASQLDEAAQQHEENQHPPVSTLPRQRRNQRKSVHPVFIFFSLLGIVYQEVTRRGGKKGKKKNR